MKEYIEREVALEFLKNSLLFCNNELDIGEYKNGCIAAIRDDIGNITHIPAADVAPVRHAHWEEYWDDNYLSWCHKCSNCGSFPLTKEETMHDEVLSNFCPDCGAIMDGGKE